MKYHYFAYGVPIIADFELPMLQPLQTQLLVNQHVIHIKQGIVPTQLKNTPTLTIQHISCNREEFLYHEPNIATYYITNGTSIMVQQQGNDWEALHWRLCLSGLVIAMIQRDKLTFHVSGVRLPNDGVVLFAAPSGTGKSTMAVKLKEKGYSMFSDDTALISVKDNICYAQSSYPMLRLLPASVKHQKVYSDAEKQKILNNWDKYAFSFQEDFVDTPLKVKAIVFLAASGEQIQITQLSPLEGLKQLSNNVFRAQCVIGMKKERVLYEHLSSISHRTPFFSATRPKNDLTFDSFATAIETSILKQFI